MQDATPFVPTPTPTTVDTETLTFAQTRRLIRSDFMRLVTWYGGGTLTKRVYWFFQPNYLALFLYRLYRYLFVNGWHNLARVLFLFSLYLTGVEISPTTSIGDRCLIAHAVGVVLFGRLGSRLSLLGQCGTGGGVGAKLKDIGGGSGYPVVGDDVVFGIKAMVIGPIRIGNRAKLGPAAFVTHDVPDDAKIMSIPSRVIKVRMGTPRPPDDGEPN